mmetsp:Transcript_3856/g.3224  ORF Transcript_3856/g.3224 Transcript_3856/m.3224 type:complete len:177 (-) Transcript_3856:33-563(-)
MLAILAGLLTLYCALVFVVEDQEISSIYHISLVIMFFVNLYFIIQWFYLLLKALDYKHKYFKLLLNFYSMLLCKGEKLKHDSEQKENIAIYSNEDKHKKEIKQGKTRGIYKKTIKKNNFTIKKKIQKRQSKKITLVKESLKTREKNILEENNSTIRDFNFKCEDVVSTKKSKFEKK